MHFDAHHLEIIIYKHEAIKFSRAIYHYQNYIADLSLNATRNLELQSCWKGLGKNKKILLEGTFW